MSSSLFIVLEHCCVDDYYPCNSQQHLHTEFLWASSDVVFSPEEGKFLSQMHFVILIMSELQNANYILS